MLSQVVAVEDNPELQEAALFGLASVGSTEAWASLYACAAGQAFALNRTNLFTTGEAVQLGVFERSGVDEVVNAVGGWLYSPYPSARFIGVMGLQSVSDDPDVRRYLNAAGQQDRTVQTAIEMLNPLPQP
jgi:hypothetical protein